MSNSERFPDRNPKTLVPQYLRRLDRLSRMYKDYGEDLNPKGILLLDRAIVATYKDCQPYADEKATAIVEKWIPNYLSSHQEMIQRNPEEEANE